MKLDGAKQLYSLQNFVTTLLILSKSQQNEKRRISFGSFVLTFPLKRNIPQSYMAKVFINPYTFK